MLRTKSFLVPAVIALFVLVISMAVTRTDNKGKAVSAIAVLYKADVQRLDSFLAQYPKYFYDSSYAVRRAKYK